MIPQGLHHSFTLLFHFYMRLHPFHSAKYHGFALIALISMLGLLAQCTQAPYTVTYQQVHSADLSLLSEMETNLQVTTLSFPEKSAYQRQLAWVRLRQQKLVGALQAAQQANLLAPLQVDNMLIMAKILIAMERTPQGIAILEQALRLQESTEKTVIDIYFQLALAYKNLKQYDLALKALNNALKRDNKSIGLLYQQSNLYFLTGKIEAAEQVLFRILAIDPAYQPAQILQIRIIKAQGRIDQALKLTQTYLSQASTQPSLSTISLKAELADLQLQKQNIEAANSLWQTPLPASSKADVRILRVKWLERTGQFEQAEKDLLTLIKQYPAHEEGRLWLVEFYLKKQQLFSALEQLWEMETHGYQSVRQLYYKCVTYFKLGEIDEAKQTLKKALSLSPDHSALHLLQASFFLTQRRLKETQTLLDKYSQRYTGDAQAILLYAELATLRRQYARAQRWLAIIPQDNKPTPQWLFIAARNAYLAGKYKTAWQFLKQPTTLSPIAPWRWDYLRSVTLIRMNRLDQALQMVKTHLTHTEAKHLFYKLRGDIFHLQRKNTRALNAYMAGLRYASNDPWLIEGFSRVGLELGKRQVVRQLLQRNLRTNNSPFWGMFQERLRWADTNRSFSTSKDVLVSLLDDTDLARYEIDTPLKPKVLFPILPPEYDQAR